MIPSPFSSFLDLYCGAPAKGLRDKPSAYRSLGVNLLAEVLNQKKSSLKARRVRGWKDFPDGTQRLFHYLMNPLSVSYFWYRNPSVYSLCPRMDRSSLPLRKRQRQEDNSLRNRSISQDLYPSVCSEEQSLANKHVSCVLEHMPKTQELISTSAPDLLNG